VIWIYYILTVRNHEHYKSISSVCKELLASFACFLFSILALAVVNHFPMIDIISSSFMIWNVDCCIVSKIHYYDYYLELIISIVLLPKITLLINNVEKLYLFLNPKYVKSFNTKSENTFFIIFWIICLADFPPVLSNSSFYIITLKHKINICIQLYLHF